MHHNAPILCYTTLSNAGQFYSSKGVLLWPKLEILPFGSVCFKGPYWNLSLVLEISKTDRCLLLRSHMLIMNILHRLMGWLNCWHGKTMICYNKIKNTSILSGIKWMIIYMLCIAQDTDKAILNLRTNEPLRTYLLKEAHQSWSLLTLNLVKQFIFFS